MILKIEQQRQFTQPHLRLGNGNYKFGIRGLYGVKIKSKWDCFALNMGLGWGYGFGNVVSVFVVMFGFSLG